MCPPGRTPPPGPTNQSPTPPQRRHAAALMRVNHAGEIAAQALYHGQALTARTPAAARRPAGRGPGRDRPPRLVRAAGAGPGQSHQPARSALVRRVVRDRRPYRPGRRPHQPRVRRRDRETGGRAPRLASGRSLPVDDERSRRIVQQMKDDEDRHGSEARTAGGWDLPGPIRGLMRRTAQIMTRTAYRL